MNERTLKAIVRYDGVNFAGWQVQPDTRTVQGELESALSRIASRPIHVHGAGRTDAGVHALAQVASFDWPDGLPCERLRRSLSRMLSPDLRVDALHEARPGFHARKSATGKRYAYTLSLAHEPDPFTARYAWRVPIDLDLSLVERLAQRLIGTHDFAGFQAGGAGAHTTTRTVHAITLHEGGIIGPVDARGLWRLEFFGAGFLYKMIRNITGTLVDIARGAIPESALDERLASPGPFLGRTAPAHGLVLVEVLYDAKS
ncbi:MAG: tRNA pseudouridine(38-40) synthase TruA [Candidatus Hydrogenedentes bacterium]|nr:tRNA pseudouridine(38-40) synthase TruA [Candidatus Hydrogenedentota bacterium]